MATTPTNTTVPPFTLGKIQELINNYKTTAESSNTPIKGLLECLPNKSYTNYDFINLKNKIEALELISKDFESQRANIIFKDFIIQLKYIECIGQDSTYLFENYQQMNTFAQLIESKLNNNEIVVATSVNQNPNYYNV